jgi:ORF6N domain
MNGVPQIETIAPRIATVRGQRVVIDADLAALYGVETKRFNEAVKRNLAKFPPDACSR